MNRLEEKRNLLKNKVQNLFSAPGMLQTGIQGFSASLRTAPTFNQHCFYKPMAIIVLQGTKQTILGSDKFTYNAGQLVVTSIDIPTVGSIVEASPEKPFMTLILDLDSYLISQLLSESAYPVHNATCRGMGITDADETLLDAFYRLVSLVDQPERQKIMAPMIVKELHYLLLTSPLGDILRSINTKGSHNNQVAKAISWLKENYRTPLKVDELAKKFNVAESSFYRHFSKVTSLSPLQYQKQLRLSEARRLMLSENFDAAEAAYRVGYESASQFNREYKRMFGMPPKTNVNQIKNS
jgi:AraC-like DNA-binding protein